MIPTQAGLGPEGTLDIIQTTFLHADNYQEADSPD
jgi:hypothetical protein